MRSSVHRLMRQASLVAILPLAALTIAACAKKRVSQPPTGIATIEPAPVDAGASADAIRRDSLARVEQMRIERERRAAALAVIEAPVYFAFDQSDLAPEWRRRLDEKLPILRASPGVAVLVEGHADERGSDEYNLALGQRRAAAAKRYLVYHGIADARIQIIGYGEERPVCEEAQESCWSRNRRAEFVITSGGHLIAAP